MPRKNRSWSGEPLPPINNPNQFCMFCGLSMADIREQSYRENPFCRLCYNQRIGQANANELLKTGPVYQQSVGDYTQWTPIRSIPAISFDEFAKQYCSQETMSPVRLLAVLIQQQINLPGIEGWVLSVLRDGADSKRIREISVHVYGPIFGPAIGLGDRVIGRLPWSTVLVPISKELAAWSVPPTPAGLERPGVATD